MGDELTLFEANRLRISLYGEHEPGWSETLDETAAYLERLGKTPREYVEAWLTLKPTLDALRQARRAARGPAPQMLRLRPRHPDQVVRDADGPLGGRWFVG